MPQLDKVTFFSQFFWLCAFYLAFYFALLKFFLPEMARVLKYRKMRRSQSQQGVSSMQEENDRVRSSKETLLEGGLNTSKEVFKRSIEQTDAWLNRVVDSINQNKLQGTNRAYLKSLGERSLSQDLSLLGGGQELPGSLLTLLLFNRLKAASSALHKGGKAEALAKKVKKVEGNKQPPSTPSLIGGPVKRGKGQ